MEKLYKVIVLFVGLIAMNNSVQAQSASFYPYASAETTIGTNASVGDFYSAALAVKNTGENDWAGINALYSPKEVTNFTNFPNPAITSTTIAYTLSDRATVSLRVIDLAGKQLAVLVKQEQAAGKQEYFWELSKNNITSGMYILVLQVENKVYSRKMIVQ
jgi:hypothetical protein